MHTYINENTGYSDAHYYLSQCIQGQNFVNVLNLFRLMTHCLDTAIYSEIHYLSVLFFRKYVIYKFPTLKFLDSKEVTVTERKEANRTGQYLRPVKPITVS